ncbi:MAG: multicopper oxidase domain-containing protein [Reyranella sp.]|uniref:multicopper oxidase domain-containing protein n=1 Tax=Reyranella sp. TaxID=1929291 RepID=UPI00272F0F54|nr:multicopper oxidase domain-containing protein [Reyranella sp.]MDP1963789.1 multicopper oxidase domain-containing protein [Reyranella sp.]MDP2374733.1 multicopper oxidase domain-containing protein [Reyranella sp.]
MENKKRLIRLGAVVLLGAAVAFGPVAVEAKTVKVSLTAKEVDLPIDNKGTKHRAWTFEGQVPGPVVRVTEGDTVEFTLHNAPDSKNSHSMDFHAARVDAVKDFAAVKPGASKSFTFKADYPGVFFYHCGADPMIQHVARGMFGVIIVDPKDPATMPKADREYVLVQSEIYDNPEDHEAMMKNHWKYVAFNGVAFKYDPVHDQNADKFLEAKPGERVRVYFVNAGPNEFSSFHPIGGIWDRVYPSGNPKNVQHGLQTLVVGPGDGAIFDLISPVEGANAIVTHSLRAAHSGAIAVIMFSKETGDKAGRGENILVR